MVLSSINPSTGETLKIYKEWTVKKIHEQMKKSIHAFDLWKNLEYCERAKILKNVSRILRKNKQTYARLITTEMGKPIIQAQTEIEKCIWVCEYYAEHGEKFLENEYIHTSENTSYVRCSPLGVILAVMPWNFPFWQVFRGAAPILMAGNGIVLKHSSNVPQCALAIEEIFRNAGSPSHTFQTLLIKSKAVRGLLKDNRVAAVTVTGSDTTGRCIASLAGAYLKKVVLELGGSDPFIVLDDVDIEYTVEQAVKARMINTGQSCIAAKRFIILQKVFQEFTDSFSEKVHKLSIGDPLEKSTEIGPLARKDILQRIDAQVKVSVQKGAKVIVGGTQVQNKSGYYYFPTVLSNVRSGMPVYSEETFGPVAALIKVRNEQEAIKKANDTAYGLGSSIWTRNITKGEGLTKQIQAGSVFVNEIVQSDPRLPFGGIKNSGLGRELSWYGIKEFVNIQTIYIKKHS
ncbi:MAG: NAD-dependent succinate-semialdehyde dehydrogenase [Candidatus Thermoplasmatota archaeon]|nr:NAD-dependent succinate-semialdehyde dehydrogenase [Candidatus Thermoplasmatota archaeon]